MVFNSQNPQDINPGAATGNMGRPREAGKVGKQKPRRDEQQPQLRGPLRAPEGLAARALHRLQVLGQLIHLRQSQGRENLGLRF